MSQEMVVNRKRQQSVRKWLTHCDASDARIERDRQQWASQCQSLSNTLLLLSLYCYLMCYTLLHFSTFYHLIHHNFSHYDVSLSLFTIMLRASVSITHHAYNVRRKREAAECVTVCQPLSYTLLSLCLIISWVTVGEPYDLAFSAYTEDVSFVSS